VAIKPMDRISISVSNLGNSLAFFRDWIGMEVIADETLEPNEIKQLWNLPPETEARAVSLKSEPQSTVLELIEFSPHSETTIREGGPKSRDYGLWAIAFRVKNIEAVYRGLTEKDYKFTRPPFEYHPDWVPHAVKEAVLIGPDNVTCGHFQRMTPEDSHYPKNYVRFDHCAQVVDNLDEAIKFYRDILGLDLLWRITLTDGLLDDLLETPPGTEVKTAMIDKENEKALTLQLFELSIKGKSLASVARPPNLGLFMTSFEVDDLSSLMETFKKEGIAILSGPVALHTKLHGEMRAITIEGPSGEMVQLFEH